MNPPDVERVPGAVLLGEHDPVASLPGVGGARAGAYARLGIRTVGELLRLAPRRFEDRRSPATAAALPEAGEATWVGRVSSARLVRARRGLCVVEMIGVDATGEVRARWFNQAWLARTLVPGVAVVLHGRHKRVAGRAEFAAPAVERLPGDGGAAHPGLGRLVPVHPATPGVTPLGIRRAVWAALARLRGLDDPLPEALRAAEGLPTLEDAVRRMHFPDDLADAERARHRFAFDELVVHELLLARRRALRRRREGIPFRFTPTLDRRIRSRFPFRLTEAQDRVVAEVRADLARPVPMNRLLQGDVGSGKTLVAAYACLAAVANGAQVAFMAPTEVLARQHEGTMSRILAGSQVRVAGLYGGLRGKARAEAVGRVAAGEVDLVVGTHAVLSKHVEFARLALVVVDEQHKFGVRQRRELVTKGPAPHCLVMTATPIPRTLAMVVYGDLDVSILDGPPPGRGPRETWVVVPSDGERVVARVKAELAGGRQVFVVYPLVEESDKAALRDATAGRDAWERALPGRRIGLVHGKMRSEERNAALEAFRRREVDLLVATVVIEVGIDVPNATVLVVEHAERFGLSQLHQLRGRVGRGSSGGLCVLMNRSKGGTPERLAVLEATDDGFRIAEEDLRLRGAGDLFGTRQHGSPGFVAARLPEDLPLLARARLVARGVVERDVGLSDPAWEGLAARVRAREAEAGDPSSGG